MDDFSFYNDERFSCPGEHAIARLNQRLRRGELTTAEHAAELRALDPLDEALIERMTLFERMDEMDCRPPGRTSGVDTPTFRAALARLNHVPGWPNLPNS